MPDENEQKIDNVEPQAEVLSVQKTELEVAEAVEKSSEVKQIKPKKGRVFKVLTAILVVIVLGLVGFLIYHFVTFSHEEKACEEKTCEVVEMKDDETGETVKVVKVPVGQTDDDVAVRELVEKLFVMAYEMTINSGMRGWEVVRTYNARTPIYRVEGMNTDIWLDLAYGVRIYWQGSLDTRNVFPKLEELRTEMIGELERNGFVFHKDKFSAKQYINMASRIVCSIDDPSLPYSDVVCSSVNWYSTVDVELINSLAEAYKKQEGEYPPLVSAKLKNVENSGYERYQKLRVTISNASGQFYRVSPENEWVFFRAGQDAPLCSEFNTDDLRRAFVGEVCVDEAGQESTVKP